ncbi:MAG: hypothetical protein ACKOJF_06105, partial [Planctomycetaceae bacterium]
MNLQSVEEIDSSLTAHTQLVAWDATAETLVTGTGEPGQVLLSASSRGGPAFQFLAPTGELLLRDTGATAGVLRLHDLNLNLALFQVRGGVEDRLETSGQLDLRGALIDWQAGEIRLDGTLTWGAPQADSLPAALSRAGLDLRASSRWELLPGASLE